MITYLIQLTPEQGQGQGIKAFEYKLIHNSERLKFKECISNGIFSTLVANPKNQDPASKEILITGNMGIDQELTIQQIIGEISFDFEGDPENIHFEVDDILAYNKLHEPITLRVNVEDFVIVMETIWRCDLILKDTTVNNYGTINITNRR